VLECCPMFDRMKAVKKLWHADKAAKQIVSWLAPCLFFARDASGRLDPKLQDDEFVLGYVYGVITISVERLAITDEAEGGYTIQQVFEHIFPNNGRRLTEICNSRIREYDQLFRTAIRFGFKEMMDTFSGGQDGMPTLLDHIRKKYWTE